MSTYIAFRLDDRLCIRCETVASFSGRREEWRITLDGTVVCYATSEAEAERVKSELVALARRIGTGALDDPRDGGAP